MLRHSKNHPKEFTSATLRGIDSLLRKFHARFQMILAARMPSGSNTVKYHRQAHIVQCIRSLGHLCEYSAQFYEASNMQQKTSYQTTNKKTTGDQYLSSMVAHQRIREAINSVSTVNSTVTSVKSRSTAYLKASDSGSHCIAAKAIHSIPTDGSAPLSQNAVQYLQSLEDWEYIKAAVILYNNGRTPQLYTRSTACLCAEVPWLKAESELHTIRASPMFHKKPYFDSVVFRLQMEATLMPGKPTAKWKS